MPAPRNVDDYLSGAIHESWMQISCFLLTDDEFATLRIEIVDEAGALVPGRTLAGENDFFARVTIAGDTLNVWLFDPRSDHEIAWQFYNDLQDFISESTFGWGELRGPLWASADEGGAAPPYEA